MSVTYGAAGTAANFSGSTILPNYPSGIAAATSKLYCLAATGVSGEAAPTMDSADWLLVASYSGGSGAAYGDSVGNRRITIWRKKVTLGTETGTATVTFTGGNTGRAIIFRVEVGSGNGISEQWSVGADSTHGTSWAVTGSPAIKWVAGQLAIVFSAQCQDTATRSSASFTVTNVTLGTFTNIANTAVSVGNDLRFLVDYSTVNSVAATTDVAPAYSHTNSVNASGPTGFLLLSEQISSNAPRTLITGAVTAGPPDLGPGRTVQRFSRMSLLRGTPGRKLGHFQFGIGTTEIAASTAIAGASTGAKTSTVNPEAGAAQFRAQTTAAPVLPGGSTDVAGSALARGESTAAKTGTTDIATRIAGFGSETSQKTRSTDVAGRLIGQGSDVAGKRRTVGTFTRATVLRGITGRRAGSFSRAGVLTDIAARPLIVRGASTGSKIPGGSTGAGALALRASSTASKLGTTAIVSRLAMRAQDATAKIGRTDIAGKWARGSQGTYAKTGAFGQAGRLVGPLGTIGVSHIGRTVVRFTRQTIALIYDGRAGSFARIPGANVYGKIAGRGAVEAGRYVITDLAGRLAALAALGTAKTGPADLSARTLITGAMTSAKNGTADHAGLALFAAQSTAQAKTGPTEDIAARSVYFGASTWEKIGEVESEATFVPIASTTATKTGSTAVQTRMWPRGGIGFATGPAADMRTRTLLFGAVEAAPILLPFGRGRIVFSGAIDAAKAGARVDLAGRLALSAAVGTSKIGQTDVAGELTPRGRSRAAIGARPGRMGAQRAFSGGTVRPANVQTSRRSTNR